MNNYIIFKNEVVPWRACAGTWTVILLAVEFGTPWCAGTVIWTGTIRTAGAATVFWTAEVPATILQKKIF